MNANPSTGEAVLFWILGPLAVFGSLGLIFAKKAVHAALGMALTMIILGVFYMTQGADFVGVIQIFVYTGAVIMLFLFVLMFVGVDSSDSFLEVLKGQRWATLALSIGLGFLLTRAIVTATYPTPIGVEAANAQGGNLSGIALLVFGRYVWPFEVIGVLLVVSAMAGMVLAHRERLGKARSQKEWSKRRVLRGQDVAGLPAPGVYARHNSVDTPALLPDGSPAEKSISRVLVARDQVGHYAPLAALPVADASAAADEAPSQIEEGVRP